jgi:hypothetical protein
MDFYKFRHPFTCMIAGPTQSGKTVLTRRLIKNYKLLTDITNIKVLWCYGVWQKLFNEPFDIKVKYLKGIPTEDDLKDINLLIIDDLMNEISDDKYFLNLFTKGSHHMNFSVIFITQNLFHQGKIMRTIGINCHYIIIMKSVRGKAQVNYLVRDTFPGQTKSIIDAYEDATKNSPYSYIRIDLTQLTPEKYRITSRLTPEENNSVFAPIVYIIK